MKAAEARFGGLSESTHTEKDNAVDLVTQTDIGEWKIFIRRFVKIQQESLYLRLLGRVELIHQEADLTKTLRTSSGRKYPRDIHPMSMVEIRSARCFVSVTSANLFLGSLEKSRTAKDSQRST